MPIGATVGAAGIGAVGAIGGAVIGAGAAKKSAKQLKKASKKAAKGVEKSLVESNALLKPGMEIGREGLYSVADLFGFKNPNNPNGLSPFAAKAWDAFKATPFYQSSLKEGIGALDHSASARGNLLSTGQMKRVQEFGADHSSRQFGTYMDRLMALANTGENAATNMSNNTLNNATNVAAIKMQGAGAQAAGTVAAGNQWSNALGTIGNNAMSLALKPNAGYASLSPSQ